MNRIDNSTVGATALQPPEDKPRLTPFQESARRAVVLDLQVKVTTKEGRDVALTAEQLKRLAARPDTLAEYGLDPHDFFAAIDLATARRVRGAELDLRKSAATSKLYDGTDENVGDNARVALGRGAPTEVATGLGESFDIRGEAIKAKTIGFWQRLANILKQIVSRLLVYGWFCPPDTPREQQLEHHRDNAATIAMVGGPGLKEQIRSATPEEAKRRLEEIIRAADPKASIEQDGELIQQTAADIYDALLRIYEDPRITDDRLADLQILVMRLPRDAFGGNPGDWLRTCLQAGTPHHAMFAGASLPLEFQAALLLAVPGYNDLPDAEQLQVAKELADAVGPDLGNSHEARRKLDEALFSNSTIRELLDTSILTPSSAQAFEEALSVRAGLGGLASAERAALIEPLYAGLGRLSDEARAALVRLLEGHMEPGQIKLLAELVSSKGADKLTQADIDALYLAAPLSPNPRTADGDSRAYARIEGPAFVDGPRLQEADQGYLGDCYLIAEMACLAKYDPDALEKIIRKNYDGSFTVTFTDVHTSGGKRTTTPVHIRVSPEFPRAEYADPTPGRQTELWAALIEKAYAVWKGDGSYQGIVEDYTGPAMEAMTGRPYSQHFIAAGDDPDALYAAIKGLVEGEPPRGVVVSSPAGKREKVHGIYSSHAYVIYECHEREGRKYITVYNPHGVDDGRRTLQESCVELTMEQFIKVFRMYTSGSAP